MAFEAQEHTSDNEISYLSSLPYETRAIALQTRLIQWEPVILHPSYEPSDLNFCLAPGIALMKRLAAYDGKGKFFVISQAREIFYGRNQFLVWLHGLEQFFSDAITGEAEVSEIVRNITVRLNISDYKEHGKDLAIQLEKLFRFRKANRLTLEIFGQGTLEGSDGITQRILQDICSVVQRLIILFGDKFNIQKGSANSPLSMSSQFCCLTSYWDPPGITDRQKVCAGVATFKELMQVQVEYWLGNTRMNPSENSDKSNEEFNHANITDPWSAHLNGLSRDTEDLAFLTREHIRRQDRIGQPLLEWFLMNSFCLI